MATQTTLAALAKLNGLREGGTFARAAERNYADDPARFKRFSVTLDDLCSILKQRIDGSYLTARSSKARQGRQGRSQARGDCSPARRSTPRRSAPSCTRAARNFSGKPVLVDGRT
jgi:hypothetical protein